MALAVALAAGGCVDYPTDQVPPVPSEKVAPEFYRPTLDKSYTIEPGDALEIQSYYYPNLKQDAKVQTDGRVLLLLVGDVMAAGKTPQQLTGELTEAYRKYLKDADLTVTVTQRAGLAVYVDGAVAKPAMIPIQGQLTLLQSIAQAGGFLPTANKEQILIVRQTASGRYHTLQADAEQVLHNQSAEIYLRRHDIVYVPKTQIAKVDQFVDQYINGIIPHSVTTAFIYQLPSAQSSPTVVTPAP